MKIVVASKRKKIDTLNKEYPGHEVLDITSKAVDPWVKFSPFYPHGDIPIPFSNELSQSVEGLWQALKVFEKEDIDIKKTLITNMKGIKRTVRRLGKVKGHRKGIHGNELLGYLEARKKIYIPAYYWVLNNKLTTELNIIKEKASNGVVLLDYETNGDINDLRKPLSHAHLVKQHLEKE
ncbi:DUF6939 family protein [Zooshikella sp. RANM57]|uniref:DUF6939 family protein n=1 Tax=Zooshikella sp. RANM57 TaxID=3425863 RepID=UPI003D6F17BE